jgi:DNA-binding HxlR family transcriptional regulator
MPGLTTKVLQQRLRKLERFGLAARRLVAEKPLHVESRLTRKGRHLVRVVQGVRRFAAAWGEEGAPADASRLGTKGG